MKKLNRIGGLIKGRSKDRIPVMMSPGSYVPKAALDKYGGGVLREINRGDITQIICVVDVKEENGKADS